MALFTFSGVIVDLWFDLVFWAGQLVFQFSFLKYSRVEFVGQEIGKALASEKCEKTLVTRATDFFFESRV